MSPPEKASLNGAYLSETDFSGADLSGAWLLETGPFGAILEGENLEGARATGEQLALAASLEGATMPDGTKHA